MSTIIAIKYHEDVYFDNSYYARVGGVSLEEFNYLEREILGLLNYSLFVEADLYQKYQLEIIMNSVDPIAVIPEFKDKIVDKPAELISNPSMESIKTVPSAAEMEYIQ